MAVGVVESVIVAAWMVRCADSPCSRAWRSPSSAIVLLLGRDEKPSAGVQLVPTPPSDGRFQSVAGPVRVGPRARRGASSGAPRAARATRCTRTRRAACWEARRARPAGGRWSSAPRARRRSTRTCSRASCFLESAGRPDAMTAGGTEGAVGLTQILAETAQNLLGMRVDVAASSRYTRRIARERRRGRGDKVARLEAARRRVDQRFDPARRSRPPPATCCSPKARLGREDLAFVAYHMGVGNLEGVLRDATASRGRRHEGPYAQVYFDSTPVAPRRRLPAARRVRRRLLQLPVEGPRGGRDHAPLPRRPRRARPPGRAADGEELGRGGAAPAGSHAALRDPEDAQAGVGRQADRRLPADEPRDRPARATRAWASCAERLDVPAALYRGLRPEALAMALYIGAADARAERRGAARGHLDRARRAPTSAAGAPQPRGDARTTRCTRPAGRSTSRARTARARRRWRSSSCSTASRCSTRSPGCASPTRSTSRSSKDAKALLPLLDRVRLGDGAVVASASTTSSIASAAGALAAARAS